MIACGRGTLTEWPPAWQSRAPAGLAFLVYFFLFSTAFTPVQHSTSSGDLNEIPCRKGGLQARPSGTCPVPFLQVLICLRKGRGRVCSWEVPPSWASALGNRANSFLSGAQFSSTVESVEGSKGP